MTPPSSRPRADLGDLESAVMSALWEADTQPLRVREVLDRLDRTPAPAYTTVMTVLDRLAKKDLAVRERDGRAWRYRPAQSRQELAAGALHATLGPLPEQDRRAALMHFVGDASTDDVDALRAALAELEDRHRS